MKYILITLLSFTFATQITTREFEVEHDGSNSINFSEISGLDYGKVQMAGFGNDIEYCSASISYFDTGPGIQVDCYKEDTGIFYCEDSMGGINVGIDFIETQEFEFYAYSYPSSETPIIKFWITGAFEDEDTSMGDMNNDGSLNVYDVLIMVGIILDGDSGDIFDIMEIIKRV